MTPLPCPAATTPTTGHSPPLVRPLPSLPLEIIDRICRFLADTNTKATLLNVMIASRALYDIAGPHLYHRLVLTTENAKAVWAGLELIRTQRQDDDERSASEFEDDGSPVGSISEAEKRTREKAYATKFAVGSPYSHEESVATTAKPSLFVPRPHDRKVRLLEHVRYLHLDSMAPRMCKEWNWSVLQEARMWRPLDGVAISATMALEIAVRWYSTDGAEDTIGGTPTFWTARHVCITSPQFDRLVTSEIMRIASVTVHALSETFEFGVRECWAHNILEMILRPVFPAGAITLHEYYCGYLPRFKGRHHRVFCQPCSCGDRSDVPSPWCLPCLHGRVSQFDPAQIIAADLQPWLQANRKRESWEIVDYAGLAVAVGLPLEEERRRLIDYVESYEEEQRNPKVAKIIRFTTRDEAEPCQCCGMK